MRAYFAFFIVAVVIAGVGGARADPGRTTWTSYLYQGPGYHFSVVDEVPQASPLDVSSCVGGWCRVAFGREGGYMRAEIIARGDTGTSSVFAQPAEGVRNAPPKGPCFRANQRGGNGGNAMTIFCER